MQTAVQLYTVVRSTRQLTSKAQHRLVYNRLIHTFDLEP